MFQCVDCGKIYLEHPDRACSCGGDELIFRDDKDEPKIRCVLCNTTQLVKQDGSNECEHCNNRYMLTDKQAGDADAWPEKLKQAVAEQHKEAQLKARLENRTMCPACKHELPENAETQGATCVECGEVYMPDAANKLIPQDENDIDKIPDETKDPQGYSKSVANPYIPYDGNNPQVLLIRQRNREQMDEKTFDEQQDDIDMSQPEKNPLIPQEGK